MVFTCRTEKKHDDALEKICKNFNIKTRQKALLMVIEDFERIYNQKNIYSNRVRELEEEILIIRKAVQAKFFADKALFQICNDER